MSFTSITPSAIGVLQHAEVLTAGGLDAWAAIGEAATALGAPADAEICASNLLSGALTCYADHGQAFELALQRARTRRMDIDCWLADARMGR